jgi:hypothetical protein
MTAPTSQNGWPANDRSLVSRRTIPGSATSVTVRIGPAGDLLLEVASLFDRLVQDIDPLPLDDWGYAERPIIGATTLSNHASGTAIDLNATRWPLGSPASVNLNQAQIDTVHQILAATGGVVRWGGDYTGRKDPMHFEINNGQTEDSCAKALAALRDAFSVDGRLFMHLTQAEEQEILAGVRETVAGMRKIKPGLVLAARSPNSRVKQDDEYGHVMNGEADAADTRVAVLALQNQLSTLIALVQKAIAAAQS